MFLVLTLCLGSLGWAMDSHEEAVLGQASCIMHGGDVPADADHGCDHCCHGVAHLVGFPLAMTELVMPPRTAQRLPAAFILHSRTTPPLLQPPRRLA